MDKQDKPSSSDEEEMMQISSVCDDEEESGWTAYFDDFFDNSTAGESYCSSSVGSPSMVSDAASSPAWKASNPHRMISSSFGGHLLEPRWTSTKKTRASLISHDESLEDTASSPIGSPKVSDGTTTMNKKRVYTDRFSPNYGDNGTHLINFENGRTETSDVRNGMIFSNECIQLKKRGLCLVPLSMLVNYLG